MAVEQLKPCPFCGGEAAMSEVVLLGTGSYNHAIECLHCGAMAADEAAIDDAVCNWNKRTDELEAARAEVAIGRERLGPAGWKLLQELIDKRGEVVALSVKVAQGELVIERLKAERPSVFEELDKRYDVCSAKEAAEAKLAKLTAATRALVEAHTRLINKSNAVTCPFRHGNTISTGMLDALYDAQLEAERAEATVRRVLDEQTPLIMQDDPLHCRRCNDVGCEQCI